MIGRAFQTLRLRIRKLFLLGEVPRGRASPISGAQRAFLLGARSRMKSFTLLRERGETIGALVLLREASLLLARAIVMREAPVDGSPPTPRIAMNQLAEALARTPVPSAPELERQYAFLSNADPLSIDRLDVDQLELAVDDLALATHWLARQLEPPTLGDLRRQQATRFAAVGTIALALVALVFARIGRPRNLALHAWASASSMAFSTTPAGAVDGIRYGQLGFHSDAQTEPWLAIDLGQDYAITRVQAFGRADCCFDQSVPLVFEVSEDGVSYRPVDRRDEPFSQPEPWILRPKGVVARFLRLRTLRYSVLVLSEVEVYGQKP